MQSSNGRTKIFPSPISPFSPVRPPLMMALIVGSTNASFTAICNWTLRSKLTVSSRPRYTSVCPFWRPKPWQSMTVSRTTSTSFSASLTASSRFGWMMAIISFIDESSPQECGVDSNVKSNRQPRGSQAPRRVNVAGNPLPAFSQPANAVTCTHVDTVHDRDPNLSRNS